GHCLSLRPAAAALAAAVHHAGGVAVPVPADGVAPARALAGHRTGIHHAAGLRSGDPQRPAVLLGWLDQSLRVLLPGAADHRRGDPALAVLAVSRRAGADRLYGAADLVSPAAPEQCAARGHADQPA